MKKIIMYSLLVAMHVFFFLINVTTCSASDNSKWIVITTINQPTKALRKFASLDGWKIVVVGDKKTPPDWDLDGCDYLSPEKQIALNFNITKLLPWNHYCRKNIGYLYAIKNGAKVIYDTDDDNILIKDTIEFLPSTAETISYSTQETVVNPYIYFGRKNSWPRGYPLEKIVESQNNIAEQTLSVGKVHPIFQQGLADLDPDVDAIFRLTQGVGDVFFNQHKQPICLPAGTMCPFNTQNTIIHSQAFWGLLIPITTKFRVCDIWRGYWAQRLAWQIGGNLCFMTASVVQERNEHNLAHDFIDEIDLYTQANALVNFLLQWQPNENNFFEQVIELTDAMVANNFYLEKESDLIRAWIQDLQALHYQEPQVIE